MKNWCLLWVTRGVISAVIVFLAACGGGGGSSDPTPDPTSVPSPNPTSTPTPTPTSTPSQPPVIEDKTPSDFGFSTVSGVEPGSSIESNTVDILDISVAVNIAVEAGEYRIEGASEYTRNPGTIENGGRLTLRAIAGGFGETVKVKLTVGELQREFLVVTRAADIEPEPFRFDEAKNAALNTDQYSDTVTISDLDTTAPISISGGDYAINGGKYVNVPGTIKNGDKLVLRVMSSNQFETNSYATVTVGTYSATFSVKTRAPRTQPEVFSFVDSTFAAMNEWKTSPPARITGLEADTTITVKNGRYRIDGSEFTDQPGTIGPDATLYVQVLAADVQDASRTVTVNVGGVEAEFTATTAPDWDKPTGEIVFPPSASFTTSQAVKIRGRVKDAFGVSEVRFRIVDRSGEAEDYDLVGDGQTDWSDWSLSLRLANTPLTITLQIKDASGNWEYEADKVVITQTTNQQIDFPPDESVSLPEDCCLVAMDTKRKRLLVGDNREIVAIDIDNGSRTQLPAPPEAATSYDSDTFIDDGDTLILLDREGGKIYRYSLKDPENAQISVIASSDDGKDVAIGWPSAVTANADQSLLYITDDLSHSIYSLNPLTGDRVLISDNTIISDVNFETSFYDILEVDSDRLLVLQSSDDQKLVWVDISTGQRTLASSSSRLRSDPVRDLNFNPVTRKIHLISTRNTDTIHFIEITASENSFYRTYILDENESPANTHAEYDFENGLVYFVGGLENTVNIRVRDEQSNKIMLLSNDVK